MCPGRALSLSPRGVGSAAPASPSTRAERGWEEQAANLPGCAQEWEHTAARTQDRPPSSATGAGTRRGFCPAVLEARFGRDP